MDMKHILQVFDSAATKPVEDSTDMRRFLSIVRESVDTANQYQQPVTDDIISSKPEPVISRYFKLAEAEIEKRHTAKQQLINKRAKIIAERVGLNPRASQDEIDTITIDVPLFIRLLEYAKEDAKTDMDLHNVAEKVIELSKQNQILSMQLYDAIVGDQKALPGD